MPDTNPDARLTAGHGGQLPREQLLAHKAPPGLKRLGVIALVAAVVIAAAGIAWRLWHSH